jgi:hypothetical protein
MIGLGILFRILKRFVGKPLESTGALPTRYYLHEILRSLDNDDIGEAVKLLRLSKGALVDKPRWEIVRQQIIFRCRVLKDRHHRRIHDIEKRIERFRRQRRLPWRWFRTEPINKLAEYEKLLSLEKQAKDMLEQYEIELKDMVVK